MGLTASQLIGQQVDMKMPLVPDGLLERAGTKCSSDFDANRGAVPTADLRVDNLFYYWDPARMG